MPKVTDKPINRLASTSPRTLTETPVVDILFTRDLLNCKGQRMFLRFSRSI